ncbi:hypothetical protein IPC451_28725 [Pseudomonas aeruginosa]|uniref:hypothetical protein n=1 Tax=Pseudomonas aeruginosa TaxID=287 RepID=UPI000F889EC9|nr:hypothetical protein [Pseudomonas aeruginosa]RUH85812.1 hypothetical protein IPC451_28725 [Pseudomonas aeruginosa]
MQIDFERDFLDFVLAELSKLGVQPKTQDRSQCALLLLKLYRRIPPERPRVVRKALTFKVPDELKRGFDNLCKAIEKGEPLTPYLSRSTLVEEHHDALLDDWGILHFHLGSNLMPDGLIERTEVVAFGIIREDCVYFLDTHPHGRKHPYTWVREHLVHAIEENWPELLPPSRKNLTPDALTPAQRKNLRNKKVNVTVTNRSGDAIFPPGGGFMSNGTAMSDFLQLQKIYRQLDWAKAMCESNEQGLRDALKLGEEDFTIHIGFSERQLFLYEPVSGIQIEFAVPE